MLETTAIRPVGTSPFNPFSPIRKDPSRESVKLSLKEEDGEFNGTDEESNGKKDKTEDDVSRWKRMDRMYGRMTACHDLYETCYLPPSVDKNGVFREPSVLIKQCEEIVDDVHCAVDKNGVFRVPSELIKLLENIVDDVHCAQYSMIHMENTIRQVSQIPIPHMIAMMQELANVAHRINTIFPDHGTTKKKFLEEYGGVICYLKEYYDHNER